MSERTEEFSSTPPPRRAGVSGPRKLLGAALLGVSGFVFVMFGTGRISSFEIDGPSMEPTLNQGERVLVKNAMSGPLRRGELVVFHNPTPHLHDETLVKRVVALPGDRVEIMSHRVHVNGVREMIAGVNHLSVYDLDDREFTIGDGEVYVLGDNRSNSHDSTEFGPLPISELRGRVVYCYWPLNRLGHVN
jgi:signal peptidase I